MICLIFSFLSYICIITFFYSVHPLFMSAMIALQSILIGTIIYLYNSISWFSYLLFMIFLSGMMVVLIYVSSLASNLVMSYFFLDFPSIVLFVLLFSLFPFMYFNLNEFYDNILNFSNLTNLIFFSGKVYTKDMYLFTILIIYYLLVLLVLIVKNAFFTKGPLRSN
uniref:NADH dehydrogenase subunit 6 n=1 Tax=Metacrangonyx panousei TaxID=1199244 RepID=K7ZVT6_9CRUS|nr:NADH dehydrogenase subunit 6 [Metacrangonyx panousei]CCI69469.1 NADH dehydrogenase subunit 6 [Metacrangonyx panousei]